MSGQSLASKRVQQLWRPAADEPGHHLAGIDGAEVGNDVLLSVELGPKNQVGSNYFRAFLETAELGRTLEPVLLGLQSSGPYPGYNWVEVTQFQGRLSVPGGEVEVPPGIDQQIVRALARLVPAGGHLMIEYDSPHRRMTARALALGVPPVATPLGSMMFDAGCVAFKDWYIPEGGREGPRKLQGYMPVDEEHARRRGFEMLARLDRFLNDAADIEWDIQALARPLAEAAMTVLRERLDVPPGPLAREQLTRPSTGERAGE